jgi:AGZA family xanthine/uracil permease-like MFS transporter
MPLAYSISDGIMLGVISYVLLNGLTKNTKKISPLLLVMAILFIIRYCANIYLAQ